MTDEAAFLQQEAAEARAAMAAALGDLRRSLVTAADARRWAEKYPWAALGVAAAGGFTAAAVLTPGPGESAAEKWSRLAQTVRSAAATAASESPPPGAGSATATSAPSGGPSLTARAVGALFEVAKLALQFSVSAAMQSPSGSETGAEGGSVEGRPYSGNGKSS